MTISALDIVGIRDFVKKFYSISKDEDTIIIQNYPEKGKLMIDFQFCRVINGISYDPIHFAKFFDSISSDNIPRAFPITVFNDLLRKAVISEDLLEISFEKPSEIGDESESAVLVTIFGDEQKWLGTFPVTTVLPVKKDLLNKDLFPIEVTTLEVRSNDDNEILYTSIDDWYLMFNITEANNYEEARTVLASFISRYGKMAPLELPKKDVKMGVKARRSKLMKEEVPVIEIPPETTEVPPIDPPESVEVANTKEKGKRRSKEQILKEKIDAAKALLEEYDYIISIDALEQAAKGTVEDKIDACGLLITELTDLFADGGLSYTHASIFSEILQGGVADIIATFIATKDNAQPSSFSLKDLQEMSLVDFAKIREGV